ncbi:dihydroxyacetone kinase family protein [Nesterenkonia alba]|uniref:dihydroxyacetone kinase family protein n=1 Tax=Nesterenkonia alba TaxID=515814 RepID=UPI0003B73D59|nr:dihydroxyacetone kinase family protein [Nesterenkonia alba]
MTVIFNDPARFMEDQLSGFLTLYGDRLRGVDGGVVVPDVASRGEVAVVLGGGSGHYPAFAGLVGPGFAHGAVVGNIFTSPSARWACTVGRAADAGRGVIFTFGNYAGDVMNFTLAARRLAEEGIDARLVIVTDDIASADDPAQRRGIAGDFTVFKVLGAAAAEGLDLDAVQQAGQRANDATRTLGVAFSGCTMPGASTPLFDVPEGHMGLGLGIHGEPGIEDVPLMSADELAELLVTRLLAETPPQATGGKVAAILNGLGTTKYEELFLLWGAIARLLAAQGLEVVEPEVGELVTSLDMGGCSLTLMWLDEDLERWWRADAYTPAFRRVGRGLPGPSDPAASTTEGDPLESIPQASPAGAECAAAIRTAVVDIAEMVAASSQEWGRIDAVAGDGDHGRGMLRGIRAAEAAIAETPTHAGPSALLRAAGRAWADDAGGTSGVLWGAALEAAAGTLDDQAQRYTATDAAHAADAFLAAMKELGGAQPGDKTLLDAAGPFTEALRAGLHAGEGLHAAWSQAATEAERAAGATAELRPAVGRARPLAEKSIGTPDPGAMSMAAILAAIGRHIADTKEAGH